MDPIGSALTAGKEDPPCLTGILQLEFERLPSESTTAWEYNNPESFGSFHQKLNGTFPTNP